MNLIAFDLVIVQPMSSFSGYINYVRYTAGSTKGNSTKGDVLNDPFRLGKVDKDYTSEKVVEAKATEQEGKINWTPIVPGTVEFIVDGAAVKDDGNGKLGSTGIIDYKTGAYKLESKPSTSVMVNYVYDNVVIPQNDLPLVNAEIKSISLTAKARRVAVYYLNRVA